eukprot:UN18619
MLLVLFYRSLIKEQVPTLPTIKYIFLVLSNIIILWYKEQVDVNTLVVAMYYHINKRKT